MFQTDQATAAAVLPTPAAAGTPGYFTNGNPGTGVAATILDADFMNMLMLELSNVVLAGGLTLSKTTYTQVRDAIKRIGQNTIILADTGAANAYTAVNATPLVVGTWVDGVVQQVKIAHANTGASTYAPDGLTAIPIYGLGLQPLQGGELALNGTAVLMRATIAGVNSGNPIAVLMECAGGAQQIPPATASQHAVPMAQAAGVVGSVRNVLMSVTTASASATLTADEIIVETALGGVRYCLSSFNKTINLAGTNGAGAMDTGSAPANGYVAIYAIYNPTTQTAALLATNAATLQGNVYGAGHMPTGYTASALLAVLQIDSLQRFPVCWVTDRTVHFVGNSALNTTTQQGVNAALPISSIVPINAKTVGGAYSIGSSAITNVTGTIGSSNSNISAFGFAGGIPAINEAISGQFENIPMITPQTLYYTAQAGAGTMQFSLNILKYTI